MNNLFKLIHKTFIIHDIYKKENTYYIITDNNETYYTNNKELQKELEEIYTNYIQKGYAVKIRLTAKNGHVYFTIPMEE
jgi:hypothetical protein